MHILFPIRFLQLSYRHYRCQILLRLPCFLFRIGGDGHRIWKWNWACEQSTLSEHSHGVSAYGNLGSSSKRECGSNVNSPSSLIYTTSSQVYFEPQPQPSSSRLTDCVITGSYGNGVFCTLRKISLHLHFDSLHSSDGYEKRDSRFLILRRGEASFAWTHIV